MNRAAIEEIKARVAKDGIGEAIVNYYGRDLKGGEWAIPFELREAWRDAYDALQSVNDLLEEFSTTEGT